MQGLLTRALRFDGVVSSFVERIHAATSVWSIVESMAYDVHSVNDHGDGDSNGERVKVAARKSSRGAPKIHRPHEVERPEVATVRRRSTSLAAILVLILVKFLRDHLYDTSVTQVDRMRADASRRCQYANGLVSGNLQRLPTTISSPSQRP